MTTSDPRLLEAILEATELRLVPPSALEYQRAEHIAGRAVLRAVALRKLASASAASGFRALTLPQYLTRLARRAGVEHLLPKAPAKPGELAAWTRLARDIGAEVASIGLWVRMWFASLVAEENEGGALLAARDHSRPAAGPYLPEDLTPEELAGQLIAIEASYTTEQKDALAAWLKN